MVAFTTVLSIPAGYAFGTMRFPAADLLFYVMLTGIVVPFEALIVPLYYNFRDVGLTDTYWGLILPQTALSISFGTFWMRAFFRSVPPELSDAARVDGATSWRILWRVLVPIGRPAIADHGAAGVHVDVERVPARAGDDLRRDAPHRTARACRRSRAATAWTCPACPPPPCSSPRRSSILYVLLAATVPARHAGRVDQGLTWRASSSTTSSSGSVRSRPCTT